MFPSVVGQGYVGSCGHRAVRAWTLFLFVCSHQLWVRVMWVAVGTELWEHEHCSCSYVPISCGSWVRVMWVAEGTELWQHRYCPCSALLGGPTADHEHVMHVFQAFNPFTAMLAVPLLLKRQIKVPNFKSLKFPPELMKGLDTSIKMHSIERRFVIGPSNILFAGVYVCTF